MRLGVIAGAVLDASAIAAWKVLTGAYDHWANAHPDIEPVGWGT
jgi:hypothetical protein